LRSRSDPRNEPFMADQIVITEKTSQAKDIRAAVGSRYGDILPAEGHLFDLLEPEDVVPAWKHWSPILLRPIGNGGAFGVALLTALLVGDLNSGALALPATMCWAPTPVSRFSISISRSRSIRDC